MQEDKNIDIEKNKGIIGFLCDITGTSNIKELIALIGISAGVVILITQIAVFSIISGDSMYPTLKNRQLVLINKTAYKNDAEPKEDDIIVFYSKEQDRRVFIKRVIGVEGDNISVSNAEVLVNGNKLKEDYLNEQEFFTENQEFLNLNVSDNEVYVMGDNRNYSNDSRDFGTIKEDDIIGKVVFSLLPPGRISN